MSDNRTNEQIVAEALSEVVLAGYRVLNYSHRSSCAYLAVTALASAGRLVTAQGVAPQEPNQTETKSGNNFVSLDPEKVADVIGAAQVIREVGEDGRTSISFASGETIARALCEAYTEGKLT